MVFGPTFKDNGPDAELLATAAPFTVIVAFGSVVVGVTVTDVAALPTLAVYPVVPGANAGARAPLLMARLLSVATDDNALVAVTV